MANPIDEGLSERETKIVSELSMICNQMATLSAHPNKREEELKLIHSDLHTLQMAVINREF